MGFVGKGRIVTEERVEPSGERATWRVVLFMDDSVGREREVARSKGDIAHARAIKARWENVTCAKFGPPPVKYSETGEKSVENRNKSRGKRIGSPQSPMMKSKIMNTDSVTPLD